MTELPWEKGWDHKIDYEKSMKCLRSVKYEYDLRGIRWCLILGSLLGCIRDGGPIPWDDDIDIAVFQEDRQKIKLANEELRKQGFWVPHTGVDGMVERDEVYIKDGQKIEAWVFKEDGDYYAYDPVAPKIRYEKSYFQNLTTALFGDIIVYVPVDSKELLDV